MASPSGSPSSYAGLPWSVWAENVPLSPEIEGHKESAQTNKDESDMMHRSDKLLFGTCPSQDEFYLVICEKCGQVIKPQALLKHIAKHSPSRYPMKTFTSDSHADKNCLLTKASMKEKPAWTFESVVRCRDKYDFIKGSRTRKNYASDHEGIGTDAGVIGKPGSAVSDGSTDAIVNGTMPSSQDTVVLSDSSQGDSVGESRVCRYGDVTDTATTLPVRVDLDRLGLSVDDGRKSSLGDTRTAPSLTTSYNPPRGDSSPAIAAPDPQQYTGDWSNIPPKPPDILMCEDIPSLSSSSSSCHVIGNGSGHVIGNGSSHITTGDRVPQVLSPAGLSAPKVCADKISVTPELPPVQYAAATARPALTAPVKKQLPKDSKCLPCKYREYDSDRHCGVLTNDGMPCTRSLTCKTHSLSLKRAVPNRRSYDDLLQSHRDAKEAALKEKLEAQATKAAACKDHMFVPLTTIKATSPCKSHKLATTIKPSGQVGQACPRVSQSHLQTPPTGGDGPCRVSSDGEMDSDDRDHLTYLTQHPRPAAVCTFGARRTCHGSFVFGRKSDFLRAAFMSAVERHLNPPPHKRLCVESKLPKEQHASSSSKDPYDFNTVDSSLLPAAVVSHTTTPTSATNRSVPKPKPKSTSVKTSKSDKLKPAQTVSMTIPTSIVMASLCTTTVTTVTSTVKRKRTATTSLSNSSQTLPSAQLSTTLVANVANVANFTLSRNSATPIFAIPNLNLGNATVTNLAQNKGSVTQQRNSFLKDVGFVVRGRDSTSLNGAFVNVAGVDSAKVYKTQIVLDDKQFTIDPSKLNIDATKKYTIDSSQLNINASKACPVDGAKLDLAKQFTLDSSKLAIDPSKLTLDTSRQFVLDPSKISIENAKQYLLESTKQFNIETSKLNVDSKKQFSIDPSKLHALDPSKFNLDPLKFNVDFTKQYTLNAKCQNENVPANSLAQSQRPSSYVTIGDSAYILDNSGTIPVSNIFTTTQLSGSTLVLHQTPKVSSIATSLSLPVNTQASSSLSSSSTAQQTCSTVVPHISPHPAPNGLITSQPTVSIKAFPVGGVNHIQQVHTVPSPPISHAAQSNLSLLRMERNVGRKTVGKGNRKAPCHKSNLQVSHPPLLAAAQKTPASLATTLQASPIARIAPPNSLKNSTKSPAIAKPLSLFPLLAGPINQSQSFAQVLNQSQPLTQAVLVTADEIKPSANSQPNLIS